MQIMDGAVVRDVIWNHVLNELKNKNNNNNNKTHAQKDLIKYYLANWKPMQGIKEIGRVYSSSSCKSQS